MIDYESVLRYTCRQTELTGYDLQRIASAVMTISLDRKVLVDIFSDSWFEEYREIEKRDFEQVINDTLDHVYTHPECKSVFEKSCADYLEFQIWVEDYPGTERIMEEHIPGYKERKYAQIEEGCRRFEENFPGITKAFDEAVLELFERCPGLRERDLRGPYPYTPDEIRELGEMDYSRTVSIINRMDAPFQLRSLQALERLGFLDCMRAQGLNVPSDYCSIKIVN